MAALLGEPEAGVDNQAVAGDAFRNRRFNPFGQFIGQARPLLPEKNLFKTLWFRPQKVKQQKSEG